MCVTVLIPTRNRPDTLRQAIASVLKQGDHLLQKVVVSDNSDNDLSAAVVAEFDHPSLHYERKNPVVHDHVERIQQLYALAEGEFCAILHDDDWWHPGHLCQMVGLLRQYPQAMLAGATHLYWRPEKKQHRWENPNLEWIIALTGSGLHEDHVVMQRPQILAYTALGGFFHYATLLMRRGFMDRVPDILTEELFRFDTDRLHLVLAAELGPVVFGMQPTASVRIHREQDSALREKLALRESAGVSQLIWQRIQAEQPQAAKALLQGLAAQALQSPKSELARHLHLMSRWICYLPEMLAQLGDLRRLLDQLQNPPTMAQRAIRKAGQILHRLAEHLGRQS